MATRTKTDKIVIPVIVALSLVVPLVVLLLMNLNVRYNLLGLEVGTFPFFHAVINACTAAGYFLIKIGDMKWHRNVMITAFALSCVFLVSYVISKISNDPVPYGGEGILRPIYFFILISHIVLSGIIVPLVLFTMYRGLNKQYIKHKKVARWTFPIWFYVSVTGVLVYIFMLPYY